MCHADHTIVCVASAAGRPQLRPRRPSRKPAPRLPRAEQGLPPAIPKPPAARSGTEGRAGPGREVGVNIAFWQATFRHTLLHLAALTPLLTLPDALAQKFKEGQVWSYRTRPNEQASTLLINKVESDARLGSIFHISVSGVRVKNCHAPGGLTQELPHFPVSRKTLEDSVLKLVGTTAPNPGYREGYATWKQAFDAGNAGIFTIPVAEIIGHIEKTVNQ